MTWTTRLTCVLAASLTAALAAAQGAPTPTLEHSAPFLGHVLTLTVEGAAPGQPVQLLQSARAGRRVLTFGILELDSAQLSVVGYEVAGPDGAARFDLTIPADAAFAELERHYQALVGQRSMPASAALSDAVHLRLLGPRVYAGHRGLDAGPDVFPAGLSIVSVVSESVVASLEVTHPAPVGMAQGRGNAVFTPSFSRGAVLASPFELVLFDPFFGEIERRIRLEQASPTLFTDSMQERLFVLETGLPDSDARMRVFDLESGDALATIELPHPASGHWQIDASGMAYIAEFRGPGRRTYIRRFGLDSLVVYGAFPVGLTRSRYFTDLVLAAGQLFVGTETAVSPSGTLLRSEFCRVDLSSAPLIASVSTYWNEHGISNITAVPDANTLLFALREAFLPGADLMSTSLSSPGPLLRVGTPNPTRGIGDMVARDAGVWALVTSIGNDENEALYRIDDAALPTWTLVGALPCFSGSVEIDSIRDAFADRIVYTIEHCGPVGFQAPLLVLHDPIGGQETSVPVGYQPRSLTVVPVPDAR